jgi:hypothetical protein
MPLACKTSGVLAAMLTISMAACSDSHGDPAPTVDGRGLGATQEAYCASHSIINVVVAPGTYHWEDPVHLLNSAEGFGPRTLSITVSDSISPSASESSTYTPSNSEISTSVGYDISATFAIDASTSVFVPYGGYARIQAFATYLMTTWDIVGTNCVGAVDGGTGVSFKPVGVYFETCEALDCSLGGGVVGGGPLQSGPVPGGTGGGGGADGGGGTGGSASGSASSSASSSSGSGATGAGGA